MDLLIPVISGILGYNLSPVSGNESVSRPLRTSVPASDQNSSINTYSSVYSKEINKAERELAEAKNIQSRDPASTNVIPPFYNEFNSTNYSNVNTQPSILSSVKSEDRTQSKIDKIMNSPMFKTTLLGQNLAPVSGTSGGMFSVIKENFTGCNQQKENFSALTLQPFDTDHNNMVPFFGANVKQNTDPNKSQTLLDMYTGNDRHLQQSKKEELVKFSPQPENIFGTQVSQDRSRFYQSDLKTKLLPLPQIKEAPLPPDSFRGQYRTVDQLRTKPRVTNKPTTPNAGLASSLVSQPLAYNKNKPEASYKNGPDRSFVTGNSRETTRLNYTNGDSSATENSGYIGSGHLDIQNPGPRQIKVSDTTVSNVIDDINNLLFTYSVDDRRNTDLNNGFRNIQGKDKYNELSRTNYKAPLDTQRDTTSTSYFNAGKGELKHTRRNSQRARTTNKENSLYSYTGDASNPGLGIVGVIGKDTRFTDKLSVKNYINGPSDSSLGIKDNESFENIEIKSNRENAGDYSLAYKIGNSLGLGVDTVGATGSKHDSMDNNRAGNIGNIHGQTSSYSMYGIDKLNGVKDNSEIDQTSRIDAVFTEQLLDNDFNFDVSSKPKKKSKVIRV